MTIWRKNTKFGKYRILQLIAAKPGNNIYSLFKGSTNYRLYYNIRELERDGYIRVEYLEHDDNRRATKLLYHTEKSKHILLYGVDTNTKIV